MSFVSKIANLLLTNAKSGEKIPCNDLWKDNDVVIYFLRRFGCPVCRWISKEISSIKPTLDANNVKLIGVGPEKNGLEEFIEGNFFSGDLYLDETKDVYKTLGFSRFSMLGALGAAVDKETRRINDEAKKIGISGDLKGDLRQLGGLIIIRKGGEQVMYFKQDKASEYVKNSEILKQLSLSEGVSDNERPDMQCPFTPGQK